MYFHPHCIDEETEDQRGWLTCQGHAANKWRIGPGPELKSLLNPQFFLGSPETCTYHLSSKARLLLLVLRLSLRVSESSLILYYRIQGLLRCCLIEQT